MKQIETFYRENIAPLLPEIWDGGLFVSMTTPIVISDVPLNMRAENTTKHNLFFEFSSNMVDGAIICEVYDIETNVVLNDERFEDAEELCLSYLAYLISVGLTNKASYCGAGKPKKP